LGDVDRAREVLVRLRDLDAAFGDAKKVRRRAAQDRSTPEVNQFRPCGAVNWATMAWNILPQFL
jgi:hypothetical protein